MDSRITDIIRNNGERLKSIKVTVLYRHLGLPAVCQNDACTVLSRFTTYFLRFKGGFGRFTTIFADFGDQ